MDGNPIPDWFSLVHKVELTPAELVEPAMAILDSKSFADVPQRRLVRGMRWETRPDLRAPSTTNASRYCVMRLNVQLGIEVDLFQDPLARGFARHDELIRVIRRYPELAQRLGAIVALGSEGKRRNLLYSAAVTGGEGGKPVFTVAPHALGWFKGWHFLIACE